MNISMDEQDALKCPSCGESNLHQRTIGVYFRKGEDDEEGIAVKVSPRGVDNSHMGLNPSPRRQGITIRFECEHCEAEPEMSIIQHKGFTYFKWENWRR